MLDGEQDIAEWIYYTHCNNNIEATFSWMKGHQNRNANYENLSLEVQLIIDADWYAGKYQKE